ncbi:MFS transporter [Actinomadura kijaniata]|uniref:MFS transporter n=1 Tax=Actinomadura kijaniata TaxID=46161 RepID=UPI00082BFD76|nr:MFS transporter [Actinomadura kijaniata]
MSTDVPDRRDRHTVAVVVAVQAAASMGYFAAMAHVVVHLRDDLGLAAGLIGLVLALRNLVQYALFLPVGALADVLNPVRTGVLACALRAVGFALLGTVSSTAGLVVAAVLLGTGGALFHPAAQSLLAGVAERRRARGYAAYTITLQISAVVAPLLGLALLNVGYWLVAAASAGLWATAAFLFSLVRQVPRAPAGGGVVAGVRTALRDRVFMWFAVVSMPTMLMADQAAVVVPLGGANAGAVTVFSCVLAAVSAAVQPWCAVGGRAERPAMLRAGMLFVGIGYLLLATGAGGHLAGLVAVAVLHGFGGGMLQPAVFHSIARLAPPARYGAYLGVRAFFSGLLAFAGGTAVGRLFELGPTGTATALVALALIAFASAAAPRAFPGRRTGAESAAPRETPRGETVKVGPRG